MKKRKRVGPSLVNFAEPTVTVKLRFPFLSGAKKIDAVTMRTACFCADLEEMDEGGGDNEKMMRLIASLTDVDQNGRGIPFRTIEKYLRSQDLLKLGPYAGEILSGGESAEDDEDEGEKEVDEDAPPKKAVALRATGGSTQG